jgi:5-methyltetrahydrofolate--homocysteine methyltransferase
MSSEAREAFLLENSRKQRALVDSFEKQHLQLVPYPEAVARRARIPWSADQIATPSFLGARVLDDIPLGDVVEYIDWSPFFMAWELKGKYPRILQDARVGAAARELYDHAQQVLADLVQHRRLQAKAVYGFWPASAVEDDIAVYAEAGGGAELARFHTLRQQWEKKGQDSFHALADFIAPRESGLQDYLGGFVLTAGIGADELAAHYEAAHDDYNAIMVKALADRLAEACAEMLHQRVRVEWGYGREERLSREELIAERYRGNRPAPGYPAQPDHTEKRTLFQLLDAERAVGVRLTENLAMTPAASICGLYFAHPQARYFAIGRLARDQVESYAARKGVSLADVEKWLRPYLGY